jgi:hypothetical protein
MNTWLRIAVAVMCVSMVAMFVGCEGDGDDGGATATTPQEPVAPTPGTWAGGGMSFRVSEDSQHYTDFSLSVTVDAGSYTLTRTWFAAEPPQSPGVIMGGAILYGGATFEAYALCTFTDPNTARADVEWHFYDQGRYFEGSTQWTVTRQGP